MTYGSYSDPPGDDGRRWVAGGGSMTRRPPRFRGPSDFRIVRPGRRHGQIEFGCDDAERGLESMDDARAEELLRAARARTEQLLSDIGNAGTADRDAANQPGDMFDSAEPLTMEGFDESIRVELEERLAAIDRAEERLRAGTYGNSIRSGQTIPDDRLESDHAAELTVEEA